MLGRVMMANPANPLVELQRLGQSPWHDNISRGLLTSGKLKKMVAVCESLSISARFGSSSVVPVVTASLPRMYS